MWNESCLKLIPFDFKYVIIHTWMWNERLAIDKAYRLFGCNTYIGVKWKTDLTSTSGKFTNVVIIL